MRTTNKSGVTHFIERCLAHGMTHVVCSPGSRNAPLVIALDEHPEIETLVIHDERSAAFYALGIAQQTNKPVGLTCTSGSAMLNYYPAVAEAFYRGIPLVIMTADRPEEWINQGDGQTIVQKGVYTNHIRYEGTVEEFVENEQELKILNQKIDRAFSEGNNRWKGPIHFNFPFTEPLYQTRELKWEPVKVKPSFIEEEAILSESLIETLREEWERSERKMILCGQMDKNRALLNALAQLADDTSVLVLVENTSNLVHPRFVHCIDRTLNAIDSEERDAFAPDLLITLGGAVVSKQIKHYLRSSERTRHWKIGFDFPDMDTYRKVQHSILIEPSRFIEPILKWDGLKNRGTYGSKWKQIDYLVKDRLDAFFQAPPFTDLSVFELILDYLPDNTTLHMGNSSVVRYCQLFDPIASVSYFSNRGTSGIDGCTSTAAGAAWVDPTHLHVLITGDVSFFYDVNALWSDYLPRNLRIILINNNGGGIFRIIDGPSTSPQLERFFEAKQTRKAEHICIAHGVEYNEATNFAELEKGLIRLFGENSENAQLLEVVTPSEENAPHLKRFFEYLKRD